MQGCTVVNCNKNSEIAAFQQSSNRNSWFSPTQVEKFLIVFFSQNFLIDLKTNFTKFEFSTTFHSQDMTI